MVLALCIYSRRSTIRSSVGAEIMLIWRCLSGQIGVNLLCPCQTKLALSVKNCGKLGRRLSVFASLVMSYEPRACLDAEVAVGLRSNRVSQVLNRSRLLVCCGDNCNTAGRVFLEQWFIWGFSDNV
jgi:hypothetical protein